MKNLWKRTTGILLSLGCIFVLAACSSSPTSRGTGEYIGDTSLAAQVKTQLAATQETKAHQINVEVYRGTVQLSGFVDEEQSKEKATEVAQEVEGVEEVVNNLIVRKPKKE